MRGGRRLDERYDDVELREQRTSGLRRPWSRARRARTRSYAVFSACVTAWRLGVVRVRVPARRLQQAGGRPVRVRDATPLRHPAPQRPGDQGQQEDEEAAQGEQQRRRPPGVRHGQPGSDDGLEQEQQAGHGGDRADRRDHPRHERDQRQGSDGEPPLPVHERAEGDADRAEELRDGDVEQAHPVRVGGVADDAGQRAHRHERPVRRPVDGEPDGERRGHRDPGPDGGGPRDRCPLRPQPLRQPLGRRQPAPCSLLSHALNRSKSNSLCTSATRRSITVHSLWTTFGVGTLPHPPGLSTSCGFP